MSRNYIAIAECPSRPGDAWWISFPSFPGVASAAGTPEAIVGQAQDAIASAIESMRAAGQRPPGTVEEAGLPAYDLNEYENPLVLLVPSPELADTAAEIVHRAARSPGQLRPRLPRRFGTVPGGSEPGQKMVSDAQLPDPGRPRPIPPPPMPGYPERAPRNRTIPR